MGGCKPRCNAQALHKRQALHYADARLDMYRIWRARCRASETHLSGTGEAHAPLCREAHCGVFCKRGGSMVFFHCGVAARLCNKRCSRSARAMLHVSPPPTFRQTCASPLACPVALTTLLQASQKCAAARVARPSWRGSRKGEAKRRQTSILVLKSIGCRSMSASRRARQSRRWFLIADLAQELPEKGREFQRRPAVRALELRGGHRLASVL